MRFVWRSPNGIRRYRSPRAAQAGFDACLLELRAGEGGADARAFLREVSRMYQQFCRRQAWSCEVVLTTPSERDPHRQVLRVEGAGALDWLQGEAGVFRVQRVPANDRRGRVHTSTITVAVLPLPSAQTVTLREEDLIWQPQTSGGPGGQYVNKTESAIRLTHKPTGISILVQDERSQLQNRAIARKRMQRLLSAMARAEAAQQERDARRRQIGRGARAEHRRTFDFADGRVTDRITGISTRQLDKVLDGRLELLR